MNRLTPNRVTHTYVQRLVASPSAVHPLLCPVREADWIEGWDPIDVWSRSGVAETDCVFTTPASAGAAHDAIWYITRHEPTAGYVEMLKITPGVTACRLSIQLTATPDAAHACEAEVTYTHTSLGRAGDLFVAGFTAEYYVQFMRDWEARINHFLRTGTALVGERD